ncbi:hypothetical protein NKR23_g11256 [Pleurostoma richardsiae]|uniref:Uncharacterized protein n=1 Tax=Pleurostoma richardsiae TaxID=41990 RepID=A0AA38RB49_9PEZI|nr:hypothetical protein NKR23_g11256 [Pleurostoma richardsiae]
MNLNSPSVSEYILAIDSYYTRPDKSHPSIFTMAPPKDAGGQSPPPERQSGPQLHEAPASGHGTDNASKKEETNKSGLENLSSNPKGPLDDAVTEKFAKKVH